jgi:Cd2+/Zn2+-exporting ATPase
MKGAGELVLYLHGLCCPNCAEEIQRAVRAQPQVEAAELSFAAQKLRITLAEEAGTEAVERAVRDIVHKIEPQVHISAGSARTHNASRGFPRPPRALAARRTTVASEREASGDAEEVGCAEEAGRRERAGEAGETGGWQRAAARLLGAAVLFVGGLLTAGWSRAGLFVAAYLVAGYDVLLRAAGNFRRGRVFDENLLMAVASLSAMALGEYAEGVAVMLFYQVGEAFQAHAVNGARRSITALLDIRPDTVTLVEGDALRTVPPEEAAVGDVIQVKPGERVPLDGVVVRGRGALDTSALTGESLPRAVEEGDEALSGCVSRDGLLHLRVTKPYGESTAAKILEMVENAAARKTRTERFITRFTRIYTPAVVLAALLLAVIPPLILPGATFAEWVRRGLIFLVVSCPCALVISVPLGYFGGIGAASRAGILCKGSDALDALTALRTLALDKTGTLTEGRFAVEGLLPASGVTEVELLRTAAIAEQASNHPIALSILRAAEGDALPGVEQAEELTGLGMLAKAEGHALLAGGVALLERFGVACDAPVGQGWAAGSVVHVARDGAYLGALLVADVLKPDAAAAMAELKRLGVARTVMMTGDRRETAEAVAARAGVDRVYAQLLPGEKLERLEAVAAEPDAGVVGYVGDGINDAPVLARADVGIAMGGLGADAAIEAADVVLMTDQPAKLGVAIRIARGTRRVVTQNIALALGVKAAVLAFSAVGLVGMWAAVFADVGVTVLAVCNAMRAARLPGAAR